MVYDIEEITQGNGMLIPLMTDVAQGLGKHEATLSAQELENFLKGFYFEELFYNLGLGFLKVGVLLCFKRIFPTRYMSWMFHILLAIVLMWWIGE